MKQLTISISLTKDCCISLCSLIFANSKRFFGFTFKSMLTSTSKKKNCQLACTMIENLLSNKSYSSHHAVILSLSFHLHAQEKFHDKYYLREYTFDKIILPSYPESGELYLSLWER